MGTEPAPSARQPRPASTQRRPEQTPSFGLEARPFLDVGPCSRGTPKASFTLLILYFLFRFENVQTPHDGAVTVWWTSRCPLNECASF